MIKINNKEKFDSLREKYRFFSFENIDYQINKTEIYIKYTFNLNNEYYFCPELNIPINSYFKQSSLNANLKNYIFNIGMIELISYWKSACPEKVIIKPYKLYPEQIKFWKKIYYHGLGEFFYLNSIEVDETNFMQIECEADYYPPFSEIEFNDKQAIIPIGGGKDSVVSLELFKKSAYKTAAFIVNPREASLNTASIAGYNDENLIIVQRKIHPQLLELNEKGFLNGHTPFSAMLGFLTAYISALTGMKHIALSNESSANESTVENTKINHQYSKSFEFEEDFRKYVNDWISPEINYFSLLRPLSEMQIAKLFAQSPQYFSKFRSCNAGSKNDLWCGNCPKCLFTWIILSPFISQEKLGQIFGSNLMNNKDLHKSFMELIGEAEIKPFECVGTVEEVNLSLIHLLKNWNKEKPLPFLLEEYRNLAVFQTFNEIDFGSKLQVLNSEHNVPMDLFDIIQKQF